jgi:hypothetical protein
MAESGIFRPDEYKHNNRDNAIVDSDGVRGGRRSVPDRDRLYALAAKADQLKENVTIVRILSDDENGGVVTEVLLVDDTAIGSPAGWELYSTGATPGTPGGGGATSSKATSFPVTQDGENTFQLPAGATGIDYPVQKQTPIPQPGGVAPTAGETEDINALHTEFDATTRLLKILPRANLKTGQQVIATYFYGGGGGAGGPIDFSDLTGQADVSQLPVADDAYLDQLVSALKSRLDQLYVQK